MPTAPFNVSGNPRYAYRQERRRANATRRQFIGRELDEHLLVEPATHFSKSQVSPTPAGVENPQPQKGLRMSHRKVAANHATECI